MGRGKASIISFVIALFAFVFLQVLSEWPSIPRIPASWVEIDTGTGRTTDQGFMMCTLKNISETGFPFRTNVYDICRQSDSEKRSVQLVNWLIQLIIVILVYFGSRKFLLNKNS